MGVKRQSPAVLAQLKKCAFRFYSGLIGLKSRSGRDRRLGRIALTIRFNV